MKVWGLAWLFMKSGKAAEVRRFRELQAEMKAAATVVFELRLRAINCA